MRILVVCGAGASSTFVAQRVRHAAQAAGRQISAVAGTEQSLPIDLDAADIVLVGPHLRHALDRIRFEAASRDAAVILLPAEAFPHLHGTRTPALVAGEPPAGRPAAHDSVASTPDHRTTPTERNPA